MGWFRFSISFALQFGVLLKYEYYSCYLELPFMTIQVCFAKAASGCLFFGRYLSSRDIRCYFDDFKNKKFKQMKRNN